MLVLAASVLVVFHPAVPFDLASDRNVSFRPNQNVDSRQFASLVNDSAEMLSDDLNREKILPHELVL